MINTLTGPLTYDFILRGMLAAVIVGITCGVIGSYVVLKSLAFMGDALAHAILPGVAVAYLLNFNLLLGALAAALIVALGIGYVSRRGDLREDTAIGVLFAGSLALGVALISSIRTYAVDLSHILFGNVLGVSNQNLIMVAVLSAVILSAIMILYRAFLLISFDPILARTLFLPAEGLRYLLNPSGSDDRDFPSNGWYRIGDSSPGHTCRQRLPANSKAAGDDGSFGLHRCFFRHSRDLSQLLLGHRLWGGYRARYNCYLFPYFSFRTATGINLAAKEILMPQIAEEPGVLFIVATPIGNFEDITLRAMKVLASVDAVVCEELREGSSLLKRLGITARELVTLNEHNEKSHIPELISVSGKVSRLR